MGMAPTTKDPRNVGDLKEGAKPDALPKAKESPEPAARAPKSAEEIETRNTAKAGDLIVMSASSASGRPVVWVVKKEKFPKLYETEKGTEHPSEKGFHLHKVKPETRTAVLATEETLHILRVKFGETIPPQQDFHAHLTDLISSGKVKTIEVQKVDCVYAKEATEDTEVVTRVQKGNEPQLKFVAAWGSDMPVAKNDILIYNATEVYRIARAEFDMTYLVK